MVRVRWSLVLGLLSVAALLLGGCRLVTAPTGPAVAAASAVSVTPTATAVAADTPAATAVATATPVVAAFPTVTPASALVTLSASAQFTADRQMAINKQIAAKLATAWNDQDYDGLGALLDAGATINNPGLPDLHDGESYVERARTVHAVIPNYRLTYDDVLAEGDQVLARETFAGKIGPTSFTYTGMLLLQLKDGKVVDLYEISDELAVRKFLGDVPNDQKNDNFGWQDGPPKPPAKAGGGDPARNKEIVRQWWEGDAAAQKALAAPGFTSYNPWSSAAHSYTDRTEIMAQLQAAFGDLKFQVEGPLIAEKDRVGVRFALANDRVSLPGIAVYRIAEGKVAEEWILWANTTLYSALNGN